MDKITNERNEEVALIEVVEVAPNRFEGVIIKENFPLDLTTLLREFEALANDQVLSLLDGVEQQIDAYKLRLDSRKALITSLQLWGERGIHFQIIQ